MTATTPRPTPVPTRAAGRARIGARATHMLHTTDPKDIGILYLATAFFFFLAGGAMALLMRGELAVPARSSCPRSSTTSWSPCTAR